MNDSTTLLLRLKLMIAKRELLLFACLGLTILLGVLSYHENQALSESLSELHSSMLSSADTSSSITNEHGSLEQQITQARASVNFLEQQLAKAIPPIHKDFELVKAQADEAAREEFMVSNPQYAALLRREQIALDNPDLQVREAQAAVMRDYISLLINMGISSDRVNAVMDRLVTARLNNSARVSPFGNTGIIAQDGRAGDSPREIIDAMLSEEELAQFNALESGKREQNSKLRMITSMTPFTLSLTFKQRELVINQLYEFSINADDANSTAKRRADSNLFGVEQTRASLKNEFTDAEWIEVEAYLSDRIQLIRRSYVN